MKERLFLFLAVIGLVIAACQTVPVTGREQLDLVSSDQVLAMSSQAYRDFMSQHKVVQRTQAADQVTRVGKKIQRSVEEYFATQNMSERLSGYQWEFNLVDDPQANAFALPGGKVVVFTGILPITENDPGLAVVLGHEIAHAVARHGNERMSQALLAQMGGVALGVALSQKTEQTQQLFMTAFGLGTQIGVLLPYGRLQESEADHLGLIFMAMAGYDPTTAIAFWQRMEKQQKGSPPQFLSTHPSSTTRIENIKALIPEAMKYKKTMRLLPYRNLARNFRSCPNSLS